MTDPITRARKEWVEAQETVFPVVDGVVYTQELHCPCPPEVVAALLDVLMDAYKGVDPFSSRATSGHNAVSAITRALAEQKP